jgi:hypothetical protein
MVSQKWEDSVSGGAGDDFQQAGLLKFAEDGDEIAIAAKIKIASGFETVEVKSCQRVKRLLPMGAMRLSFRQFDKFIQVPEITLLEQRVRKHRTKRRRQGEREADSYSALEPLFEESQKRNVGFGYGFEEPILFEKLFVLRMANKGQMSVEDESEVAFHSVENRDGP